jgi:hypothetical protein
MQRGRRVQRAAPEHRQRERDAESTEPDCYPVTNAVWNVANADDESTNENRWGSNWGASAERLDACEREGRHGFTE